MSHGHGSKAFIPGILLATLVAVDGTAPRPGAPNGCRSRAGTAASDASLGSEQELLEIVRGLYQPKAANTL
jgi:hypothetical protein